MSTTQERATVAAAVWQQATDESLETNRRAIVEEVERRRHERADPTTQHARWRRYSAAGPHAAGEGGMTSDDAARAARVAKAHAAAEAQNAAGYPLRPVVAGPQEPAQEADPGPNGQDQRWAAINRRVDTIDAEAADADAALFVRLAELEQAVRQLRRTESTGVLRDLLEQHGRALAAVVERVEQLEASRAHTAGVDMLAERVLRLEQQGGPGPRVRHRLDLLEQRVETNARTAATATADLRERVDRQANTLRDHEALIRPRIVAGPFQPGGRDPEHAA